jgi:hypothetical protein
MQRIMRAFPPSLDERKSWRFDITLSKDKKWGNNEAHRPEHEVTHLMVVLIDGIIQWESVVTD